MSWKQYQLTVRIAVGTSVFDATKQNLKTLLALHLIA